MHTLKKHGLRETTFRKLLLNNFEQAKHALNLEELRSKLPEDTDRITLYRTLQSFEQSGLIHSIPDTEGNKKYALCLDPCDTHGHNHSHAHFTCQKCQTTWCLDHWALPPLNDNRISAIATADLIVTGTCAQCAA
jgi:Fur family ferric uptake transcriptional regulator